QSLEAETIFFVDNNPTVLFFKLDVELDTPQEIVEQKIQELQLKVWNTSWIPSFFVALPTELRIYSAYQKPVKDLPEWMSKRRWLDRVTDITKVVEKFNDYNRPEFESGRVFQERAADFNRDNRVDRWLLKNLRLLRQRLEHSDTSKREYIHALIGRSIFIRYLEDREVLVQDYFADLKPGCSYSSYADVLVSKEDTYKLLFPKLRADFNGDVFPLSKEEDLVIGEDDLRLLRDFLLGKSMDDQQELFFWAYQFDIIPIELISSIYEDFYHEYAKDDDGTHYTPIPLVDFILSQSLTKDRLEVEAKVLDPSCGSGVFLVEAFKRMVYYECRRSSITLKELERERLTEIFVKRFVGFDINKAAIQVAAFSLYLAYLGFRNPPDIRRHKQLPKLIHNPEQLESGKVLFHINAFSPTSSELNTIQERPRSGRKNAAEAEILRQPLLPIGDAKFDIIVGNPPWGADKSSPGKLAIAWCKALDYPVGDQELSQCFVWRSRELLKHGGEIGLLVSTGVLFKHQDNSREFRQQWLKINKIRAVYNFAHVRFTFFRKQKKDAVAPFAAIFFAPDQSDDLLRNRVSYISIKRSTIIEQLQSVIIDKTSLHKIRQSELVASDWLWKTYMWGGASDAELISELKSGYRPLIEYANGYGRGYQDGGGPKSKHTDYLDAALELPTKRFGDKADVLSLCVRIEPRPIHALGQKQVYRGPRLLIKRGPSRSKNTGAEIKARLEKDTFAFANSIIGVRLDALTDEQRNIILGILTSSLGRYYHFLTCSTWGAWRDEIHVDEHMNLPVNFPDSVLIKERILEAVRKMTGPEAILPLFGYDIDLANTQQKLDDAIFDLYELSEEQRDLVRDLCQVTLDFFYKGTTASATKSPSIEALTDYCEAFMEIWNDRLLSQQKELEANIYAPHHGLLCGMSFELKDLGSAQSYQTLTAEAEWQRWFRRLSKSLAREYSSRIYIDRTVRELTDSSMFIIKRAEKRFWTKSQARQDAKELLTEVFRLEWQHKASTA
ncbi:MAG: N-6 DNA methylase, partial [Chloroflexota bacterium]|nr:N-6 DNA methylase [Chloroflexota bacterium]